MNPLVSIICPVYNKEKYISKCVKSILNQTYSNIELIIVDDCGNDNSIVMVKKIATKDSRIKFIFHPTNKGVDQARFSGLQNAKGAFVMFVDSDDWLSLNAVELLLSKSEGADIVFGSMVRIMDNYGLIKSKPKNNYSKILFKDSIQNPELFDNYFCSYFGINKLMVSMCAKLYRKELLDSANLMPSTMKMGEDLIFNMNLHPFLNKISFITESVYFYRFGGMTNTSNSSFLINIKEQYNIKMRMIEKYNYLKVKSYIDCELVNCFYSHFQNLFLLDKRSEFEVRNQIIIELTDPIYKQIEYSENNKSEKSLLLLNNNLEGIINLIKKDVNRNKNKFIVKKVLSKILRNL